MQSVRRLCRAALLGLGYSFADGSDHTSDNWQHDMVHTGMAVGSPGGSAERNSTFHNDGHSDVDACQHSCISVSLSDNK